MNPDTLFLTRIKLDYDSVIDPTRNRDLFTSELKNPAHAHINSHEVHRQLSYLYPEIPGGRANFREFYKILWRYEASRTRRNDGHLFISSVIPPHPEALNDGVGNRNWQTKKYLPPRDNGYAYQLRVDFSPHAKKVGEKRHAVKDRSQIADIAVRWLKNAGLAPADRMHLVYLGRHETRGGSVPIYRLNTRVDIINDDDTAYALRHGLTTPAKCYGAGLISLHPTTF